MQKVRAVYEGRDNPFAITLKKNGVVLSEQDMQAISKLELRVGGVYYNSQDNSDGFTRDDATATFKVLPRILGLTKGRDIVEVIIYDNGDFRHGFVVEKFILDISGEAVPAVVE